MNRSQSSYPDTHRSLLRGRLALASAAAILLVIGIAPRLESRTTLAAQTTTYAAPTVAVTYPSVEGKAQHLELPADVEAFAQTQIYARTSGYLARWYADIGTHMAAGAPLAEISTPEIEAQLQQATRVAETAQANYDIAKVTADRWTQLLKTHSVSEQETQQDLATMKADRAVLQAAQADVKRLQELVSYEHVSAPFEGIVTARNVDVGALINAGSTGGAGSALFSMAETDKLRVFVDVPQQFAPDVAVGTSASLRISQRAGRSFSGKVARTSGAIDVVSRTLRIEVDFDNPDGQLLPGTYGTLDLILPVADPHLSLPVSAFLFRPDGVQVAVVDNNNRVQLAHVQLGQDFGTRVEVVLGLSGAQRVIVNPNDGIVAGEAVRVVSTSGRPS